MTEDKSIPELLYEMKVVWEGVSSLFKCGKVLSVNEGYIHVDLKLFRRICISGSCEITCNDSVNGIHLQGTTENGVTILTVL